MGSEAPAPLVEKTIAAVETSVGRSCAPKTKGKVPRRIHKAEREKLKREHLNELFLDLANALDPNQPNNGKASILCEATRLLKDLFGQIETLKKENACLLSESHYVTPLNLSSIILLNVEKGSPILLMHVFVQPPGHWKCGQVSIEKNELKEENSTLETQIQKLQSEIGTRVAQSKPDLNEPPLGFQQSELSSHFRGDRPGLPAVEPALQQASALLVVPIHPDIQAYPVPDSMQPTANTNSSVSKPHARYPTPADSWPSQLLGKQSAIRNEFGLDDISRSGDRGAANL